MLCTCDREVQTEKKSLFSKVAGYVWTGPQVRLLLELYCVVVIKHVAFFAVCAT